MSACTSVKNPGRNPTIDAAKGLGILLVVFAHIYYGPISLSYIYSFHMPLFFILSGLLFRKEKYNSFAQFLTQRFYSLILPYLFFYAVALLIYIAMAFGSKGLPGILSVNTLKAFIQMFLAWGPGHSPNNPLWFIPCLLCVEIIYFFISKTKTWINITICTVLVILGWFIKSEHFHMRSFRLLWNLDISLFTIGFYALGNLLRKKFMQLQQLLSDKTLILVLAVLLCGAILFPIAMYNGKISIGSGIFGNGALLYATGVIGTLGVLFLACVTENCPFLRYLGKNTFGIMGTHYVIRNVYMSFCSFSKLGTYDNTNIAQSIFPFLLVLSASIVCTQIYNRIRRCVNKKECANAVQSISDR